MRYQGLDMTFGLVLVDIVDRIHHALHPSRNAFWDDVLDLPDPRIPSKREVNIDDRNRTADQAADTAEDADGRRDAGLAARSGGVLRRPRTPRLLVNRKRDS